MVVGADILVTDLRYMAIVMGKEAALQEVDELVHVYIWSDVTARGIAVVFSNVSLRQKRFFRTDAQSVGDLEQFAI